MNMEESDNGYSSGLLSHRRVKSGLWVRVPPPPQILSLERSDNGYSTGFENRNPLSGLWVRLPPSPHNQILRS